jgi:glutamate-5-semialdehyde dehydrogenase
VNVSAIRVKAKRAKETSLRLAQLGRKEKDAALLSASRSIMKRRREILEANDRDVLKGEAMLKEGTLSEPLLERLKLDEAKVRDISTMIRGVEALEDPVGRNIYSMEMDQGLDLYKVTVPFGVVLAVFESRPDALAQISALCIKSGNSVVLKGGSEARESNRALFAAIHDAFVGEGLPPGCMELVEGREAVAALLEMEDLIDLVVPRGSNEFVRHVQESTKIPVLGHSAGICHIYVDRSAEPEMAVRLCYDAKVQYPATCNSMKVLLVDEKGSRRLLPRIARELVAGGVRIKACRRSLRILRSEGIPAEAASEGDWSTEYLDLTLPVKVVRGVDEAIAHINAHGSRHTDSIISEDPAASSKFLREVDSANVMHNASTRFSDGYRYGLGAEVGISTNKVHARGPVGLDGLVTTKYLLMGSGQRVSDYTGRNARRFIHRRLPTPSAER